ncbi:MAG: NIL domain-containing protein, partial [Dehalococcoidales bacterium]
ELLKEPIIYSVGQQFQLTTNIHRADVAEDRGCIELDLTGEEQQIDEGIAWIMGRGVRVEVLPTEG